MRQLVQILILLVLVSTAIFIFRSKQRAKAEHQQATEQVVDDDAGLRQRAQARVARMKAEGWKNEENVSMEDIMKMAETQIQFDSHKQAITLLERALFREPDNLEIEATIERQEEMLRQSEQK